MKSVALLARKGGTGKTTIAIHMGALAQAAALRVAFVDLDPQQSLTFWWRSRAADTPALLETDAASLRGLLRKADGAFDLVVIDTPPAIGFDTALIAGIADLALIPLRPSILDVRAVESTVTVVGASRTKSLLVLNACHAPRGDEEAPATAEARLALESMQVPIADTSLAQRMDCSRALNGGEAVNEFAPASKAAAELERLWGEVQRRLR